MGSIIDIYNLIRNLIDEAEKQHNIELVSALIDIKKQVSDIENENKELKNKLEINESVTHHNEGTYITLNGDELNIHYCAICWGRDHKLIQMKENRCLECDIRWVTANRR